MRFSWPVILLGVLAFSICSPAISAPLGDSGGLSFLTVTDGQTEQAYSVKLQILLLMTALSFIPAFLLMATCFTRIIIVLAILRQALGLQQSPPNRVLIGITLALTILIMRPVWTDVYDNAFKPYDAGEITLMQAFNTAEKPVREFMLRQTQQTALEQMLRIANEPVDQNVDDISLCDCSTRVCDQ